MPEQGCAALSALWYVSKRNKLPSSIEDVENDILHMVFAEMHYQSKAPISESCFVQTYDGIAEWYGIKVIREAKNERPSYHCKDDEEEILEWYYDTAIHFTAGNGKGIVTYDPLGYWRGFPSATLLSKRIICWDKTVLPTQGGKEP